jgi:integration host factor subunit beta
MIKSELIAMIALQMTHLPENKISEAVNLILETMTHSLVSERRVEIRGFGSFSVHLRNPRHAHNPRTGEKIMTKPKLMPHFKPGKGLRERVKASRAHFPIIEPEKRS